MIGKTGIFGGLRRCRWALGLAFGYALLLNALLGTSVEGAMAAARNDPLSAAAAASLCSPGDPAPASPRHAPADHQQTCPLCGPACPMAGSTPLQGGIDLPAVPAPREIVLGSADRQRDEATDGRRLYASDADSQGPPAA
ncbi:MAG TPA: hypothetical protein VHA35_16615 [Dongiaceae bacterium]|nr:hypothetical protein [Dongiaceae bacterium]